MKPDREHSCNPLEVRVRRENQPSPAECNGTDEHVDNGNHKPFLPARIAGFRRRLIVSCINRFIREGPQIFAELPKLGGRLNAGKQLLTNEPDDTGPAFANELPQFRNVQLAGRVQVRGATTEGRGPHGSIHENIHARFERRSRL